jgi:hypothetical protein
MAPSLESSHLIADAHQHFANVVLCLAKLVKSFCSFVTMLVIGISTLRIKITSVRRGCYERIHCLADGIVGSSVFITQRGGTSAIEMESGDGCHEEASLLKTLKQYTRKGPSRPLVIFRYKYSEHSPDFVLQRIGKR